MTAQLRLYTINRGDLQQFAKEWKEKIYPLRRKLGFSIEAAWTIEETNQFVWLLRLEEDEGWQEKDQAYYASPERKAMDPDPARLIARAEEFEIKKFL